MTIELNHTIVWCRDKKVSASFLTELFDLPDATRFGPFLVVEVANGVSLDYREVDGDIASQHYAFLVSEDEFDAIYGKIVERGLDHWADPGLTRPKEINRNDGGRGVYFTDPDGHLLEIITRPYGSGA
ncbi:MAG TPA: VOC family protein [Acidimicrobiia bacterium]|nr:VOC family protein [Acidimicrobiia bacterium]